MIHFWLGLALLLQADAYNPIYRGDAGEVFSRKPSAFLVEMAGKRKPGRALDVGMGQGRNALWLAQQGWDVTGFDLSDEGIRQTQGEAKRLGLKISASVAAISDFDFGENRWDLIVITWEPTKLIAPKVLRALRPGGAVLVEDRHLDTRRVWPAGTFADNELIAIFPGLRVVRYDDLWARPDWSARGVEERVVRLVAEKPLPRETGCIWEGKPVPDGGQICWDTAILRCQADGWLFTREKCAAPAAK